MAVNDASHALRRRALNTLGIPYWMGQEQFMEPEEMDLVELVEKVAVEPSWRIQPNEAIKELNAGERGMVVHRREGTPTLFDVEFLDPTTKQVRLLATLGKTQLRVVERDTLDVE